MKQNYLNWRQTDPRFNQSEAWPSALFPQADFHVFRDCGCLVCALAVMLRHGGVEKEEDEALFDPWILNQRLIAAGAFSDSADLELSAVQNLYPLVYLGSVPYSEKALAQLVESGHLCLVTVPGQNADRHFTAFYRFLPGGASVIDPLCGERKLSSYDRVCEIRVFRKAEETESAE